MSSDLSFYYNRVDIISETANQIIKDFCIYEMEIKFLGNAPNAYQELFMQIHPFISKMLDNNYQKLLQILYRIDVNEKHISDAVQIHSGVELSKIITDLIIKRELQKVVIRNYYNQSK